MLHQIEITPIYRHPLFNILFPIIAVPLFFTHCLFNTQTAIQITPDLHTGNEWMYQYQSFLKPAKSNAQDTLIHFNHYQILGDTLISWVTYKLLLEEELALFNHDYGLVKNKTLFALNLEPDGIQVLQLKQGNTTTGSLPFKLSAIDTAHFEDQFFALPIPIPVNTSWNYRDTNNLHGRYASRVTAVGVDQIMLHGVLTRAYKFEMKVTGMEYFLLTYWIAENIKVLTRLKSAASNPDNGDSLVNEEIYLGARNFLRADTEEVFRSSSFK